MSERSGAAGENNGKIASARRKGPTGARGAREANAKRPGKNLSVEVNRAHGTRRGRGLLGGLGGHRLHHLPRTLVLTVDESYPRASRFFACRSHVAHMFDFFPCPPVGLSTFLPSSTNLISLERSFGDLYRAGRFS